MSKELVAELVASGMAAEIAEDVVFQYSRLSKNSDYDADADYTAYSAWADAAISDESLRKALEGSWYTWSPSEKNVLSTIVSVTPTDYDRGDGTSILGLAKLHSKEISLHTDNIVRSENHAFNFSSVSIHEAQHAVFGHGENEATRADQRYLGRMFAVSKLQYLKSDMSVAFRLGVHSQTYRQVVVHPRHRIKDYSFLVASGYSPSAARRVMKLGKESAKVLEEKMRSAANDSPLIHLSLRDDLISKEFENEWGRIIDDVVEKVITTPTQYGINLGKDQIESSAKFALLKRKQVHELGPMGVIPALRRASYHDLNLAPSAASRRRETISQSLQGIKKDGLFDAAGEITDAHLKCVLNGWSPVPHLVGDFND